VADTVPDEKGEPSPGVNVPDKDPVFAQIDPAGGATFTDTVSGIEVTAVFDRKGSTDEVAGVTGVGTGGLVTVIVTDTVIAVAAPTAPAGTVPEKVAEAAVIVPDTVGVKVPVNVPAADQVPPEGVIVAVVVVVAP